MKLVVKVPEGYDGRLYVMQVPGGLLFDRSYSAFGASAAVALQFVQMSSGMAERFINDNCQGR